MTGLIRFPSFAMPGAVGLLLCLLLSACGFTLRGGDLLPAGLDQVWLTSNTRYSPMYRTMQSRLQQQQIATVSEQPTQPARTLSLHLNGEQLERRLLSMFSSGQVAEYELIYQINYRVTFPGKVPQQAEVIVTQEYQDDPDAVLANSRELDLVVEEMRQRAGERMLRMLPNQLLQSSSQ